MKIVYVSLFNIFPKIWQARQKKLRKGGAFVGTILKRTQKGAFCVVRTKGFAPLAARPATPLSMAYFAVKFIVIQSSLGKAFCSRKTAPTLKSLRVFVSYQKENTYIGVLFLVRTKGFEPTRLPTGT